MEMNKEALERSTLEAVLDVLEADGYDMQKLVNKVHIHAMTSPMDSRIAGIGPLYKPAIVCKIEEAVGLKAKHE